MAWYAVYRYPTGEVATFIHDDRGTGMYDDPPAKKWDSEKQAREGMKGHVLESNVEFIEL